MARGESTAELVEIGRARSNYAQAGSQAEREKFLASVQKYSAAAKEEVSKARPLFVSDRAKELFTSFDRQWEDYQHDMQKALALAASI